MGTAHQSANGWNNQDRVKVLGCIGQRDTYSACVEIRRLSFGCDQWRRGLAVG